MYIKGNLLMEQKMDMENIYGIKLVINTKDFI